MRIKSNDETRVLDSSPDLDDYEILSVRTLSAAVPHKTTESLRRLVWGAMATYSFGNKSVDHGRPIRLWDLLVGSSKKF